MKQTLALVLIAIALGAGLLIGHFIWKSPALDTSGITPSDTEGFNTDLLSPMMRGKIPEKKALPNLEAYRSPKAYRQLSMNEYTKVGFIVHDSGDIRRYISETFPKFANDHTLPNEYHWTIALYPFVGNDTFPRGGNKTIPRIGVYIIPTLYKTDGTYIDYLDAIKDPTLSKFYRPKGLAKPTAEDSSYIFDEGHLWP